MKNELFQEQVQRYSVELLCTALSCQRIVSVIWHVINGAPKSLTHAQSVELTNFKLDGG